MKSVMLFVLSALLSISVAFADTQEKPVTHADASKAAGLNSGAQQSLVRTGIDLKKLALGIAEAYRIKPSENRLQKARQNTPANKKISAQASFDLGLIIALETQEQLKSLDVPAFMEGFKTAYSQRQESPQLAAAMIVVNQYVQQQRMLGAEERLLKSNEFLAENAKRSGVVVTKSGLQYEVLAQGSGAKPTWADMVTVNYRHTKPNSDFMYDSAEHGHSETMPMRGTIPEGWHELFLLMNKGARYRVYLPPGLGWGAEGNGDALLPNEVLITEFTLLDIVPPPPVAY